MRTRWHCGEFNASRVLMPSAFSRPSKALASEGMRTYVTATM